MVMHRFFVPKEGFCGSEVVLSGADARQIRKVLRLKPGDLIEVLDGSGSSFLAILERVSPRGVQGRLLASGDSARESHVSIALAQVLPRWPKMDLIVQKATELGVARVIPLWAERTSSRGEAIEPKLNRWRRIAKESAEQCGRAVIPPIEPPVHLLTFLDQGIPGMKILFWEGETERRLRDFLRGNPEASSYVLLVGAEGGFSAQEVERAKSRGFVTVSLGKRIMRCESMALIALALVQYERGDLG